jgi:Uma2 family endonuclease
MVDSPKRREATYRDVLDAPEHVVAEIVDGELFLSPRPAGPHARARSMTVLGTLLTYAYDLGGGDGPGGWYFLNEPELHFGKDVVVPDIAAWRIERAPKDIRKLKFLTEPPDWLCEGLSLSTRRLDRFRKLPLNAKVGVRNVWLFDALASALEVHRRTSKAKRYEMIAMFDKGEPIRAEPFEALELRVEQILGLLVRAGERPVKYGR